MRDHRGDKLDLFAPPGRPGPKSAPYQGRVRAQVIELWRAGLSVHEISARLRGVHLTWGRTRCMEIRAKKT